eukprot:TRINITY_DN1991_c0_g1_i1.p1 TRINITY_DN1991_c0_g1~~TRINITY_DN1991_c0_g1_i1.p1  ORF type:complete len:401 (-),score=60.65 TRINITY_DN1991_c0_g1_i1:104-1141(-)
MDAKIKLNGMEYIFHVGAAGSAGDQWQNMSWDKQLAAVERVQEESWKSEKQLRSKHKFRQLPCRTQAVLKSTIAATRWTNMTWSDRLRAAKDLEFKTEQLRERTETEAVSGSQRSAFAQQRNRDVESHSSIRGGNGISVAGCATIATSADADAAAAKTTDYGTMNVTVTAAPPAQNQMCSAASVITLCFTAWQIGVLYNFSDLWPEALFNGRHEYINKPCNRLYFVLQRLTLLSVTLLTLECIATIFDSQEKMRRRFQQGLNAIARGVFWIRIGQLAICIWGFLIVMDVNKVQTKDCPGLFNCCFYIFVGIPLCLCGCCLGVTCCICALLQYLNAGAAPPTQRTR